MNSEAFLGQIDPLELMTFAPELVMWRRGLVDNEDDVAQFMFHGGPVSPRMAAIASDGEDDRPDKSYWDDVKTEMHLFLCTDDARYRELWKRINALENKSSTALVGIIAAFLGASLGVAAALLAGFVAVCLYAFAKLGKEAYCRHTA